MVDYNQNLQGYYTSDGNAKTLALPYIPDWIEVMIQGNSSGDNWESTANPGVTKEARWYTGMAEDSALLTKNTNSAATDTKDFVSSSGVQTYRSTSNSFGSTLAITGISQANPAVVSLASTSGLSTGDVVMLTGSTGQLQIAGVPFTIGSLVANTSFTLAYLNSSGFAAAATAGNVKKVLYPNIYLPKARYITNISKAASAVITFSVAHNYSVGDVLRIRCPSEFGMTQIDGLVGKITAVNTSTNTATVDINSSAFTTFAFPTSAVAGAGTSFPMGIPLGEQTTQFDASYTDNGSQGLILGTNVVGPSGALVLWRAGLAIKVYTS